MKISNKEKSQKNVLRLTFETDEETFLFMIKTYLEAKKEVEIVGVYKAHHLIDETKFYLKTKKEIDAGKFFKEELSKIKKEIEKLKIK